MAAASGVQLLGLKESGVDFVAADVPNAKAALQAAKRRGVKLGGDRGVMPSARAHKLSAVAPLRGLRILPPSSKNSRRPGKRV